MVHVIITTMITKTILQRITKTGDGDDDNDDED